MVDNSQAKENAGGSGNDEKSLVDVPEGRQFPPIEALDLAHEALTKISYGQMCSECRADHKNGLINFDPWHSCAATIAQEVLRMITPKCPTCGFAVLRQSNLLGRGVFKENDIVYCLPCDQYLQVKNDASLKRWTSDDMAGLEMMDPMTADMLKKAAARYKQTMANNPPQAPPMAPGVFNERQKPE